jgi:hypothetical protein
MIRALQPDEAGLLLEGGASFYQEGQFGGVFNAEFFRSEMERIMHGSGVVLAAFTKEGFIKGAIAATITRCIYTGDRLAAEIFWYMIPRFRGGMDGVRLILAYDKWCQKSGVKIASMVRLVRDLSDDGKAAAAANLHKLYISLGFQPLEIYYIKRRDL